MKNLDSYRKKLDVIDKKVIKLYEKRMNTIKKVIEYKTLNDIPVLDANRESEMLEKNLEQIKNPELKKYYQEVLNGFLKASKDMQKDILIKH